MYFIQESENFLNLINHDPIGKSFGYPERQPAWVRYEFIEDTCVKKVKEQALFVETLNKHALSGTSRTEKKIRLFCWGCEIS